MNTTRQHGIAAALFLLTIVPPVCADDMTMVLPIVAVPFLVVGVVVAFVVRAVAKKTRVRTGVLIGVLVVGTLLTGIPGAIAAIISIGYVASRFADIAIPYLIGFLVYAAIVVLAFVSLKKRPKAETRGGNIQEPQSG